jgi:tetratricopeptide (TPR) repeat protein
MFLACLGEGPSLDPAGRAWQALAQYQNDNSLFDDWTHILALDPGVPWYHGQYGLMGVDLLPNTHVVAGIPPLLAHGVRRLGRSLRRLNSEGYLNEGNARREFVRLSRWVQRRYPFRDAWRSIWLQLLDREDGSLTEWVLESLGLDRGELAKRADDDRWSLPKASGDWHQRAQQLREQIKRPAPAILRMAHDLLSEIETYYYSTGDAYDFVRAVGVLGANLPTSLLATWIPWLEKAVRFDPANPYPVCQLVTALTRLGRLDEAERLARWAVCSFPLNVVARTGYGEVLKAAGRLAEAELVYRETVQRFPDNSVARNGLGEVLKVEGKLSAAEAVYRGTVARFPNDGFARNGLAEVLKALGRFGDAEREYRESVRRFQNDVVARNGLGNVLRVAGQLNEAEHVFRQTMLSFPDDLVTRNGLGEVLRASGRLVEAEHLYRETMRRSPQDVFSRNGLGDVLRAAGRTREAIAVYRETLRRFPNDPCAARGVQMLERRSSLAEGEVADFDDVGIPEFDGSLVPELDLDNVPFAVDSTHCGLDVTPVQEPRVPGGSERHDAKGADSGDIISTSSADTTKTRGLDSEPLSRMLGTGDIELLVQDSHLLRRWARSSGEDAISHLREEARALLGKLERFLGSSPAAVMESSLLLIETNEVEAAMRLLNEAHARYPGSKRVQYALARTRREAARQAWRDRRPLSLHTTLGAGLQGAWGQLPRLEPMLLPSARLGLVRSLAYLTDGEELNGRLRSGLGELAGVLRSLRPEPDSLKARAYWAHSVGKLIFGERAQVISGASGVSDADVAAAVVNCEQNRLTLNGLEEDLILHYRVS